MAERVGHFANKRYSKSEHHEWAWKLWERIDRDHSGSLTQEELNCDEFQDVLHAVIAPLNDGDGRRAVYGRSEINVRQAMDFCYRKADINSDGSLTFEEFKSFMRALRNTQQDARHAADLVFALFDLDGTLSLDKEEFLEIFRYYTGRTPTATEFQRIWDQLDTLDTGSVTKQQYIKWMQHSAPEQFRQHAPPVDGDSESGDSKLAQQKRRKDPTKKWNPAPGMMPRSESAPTWSNTWHVPWNERFRGKDPALVNPETPKMLKHYFSAPQTMPQLGRFYNTYKGFSKHRKAHQQPPTPRQKFILSNQSQPEICPERAIPGGFARNSKGDSVPWNDHWQPTQTEIAKRRVAAGSLMLRVPGKPPPCLTQGRDAQD